jgi:ADP-ribose pyrophosphatase YjhB (NUDIX family)
MLIPEPLATEVAALVTRYGQPAFVEADLPDNTFDPLTKTDRFGEVCMVIRRPNGRLLTARKTYYPPTAFRLLTGGIAHGERIEAALLREVEEETSLAVTVSRFLAVIGYRAPQTPPGMHAFYTFAFLLDERGGTLAVQDPEERVAAFGEVTPGELLAMAETLETIAARHDPEIGGSWHNWGIFRAVVHRVVANALAVPDANGGQP